MPARATVSIGDVPRSFTGQVISPDDPAYDPARTVVYGDIDKRPAVILRPADVDDVVRVVNLARDTGSELAVRCGGHSVAGHSVSEGGIVIDLRDLKAIDIDVDGRTAWADAGLTAAEYSTAANAHGLATGFGDTGSVGIAGITLGGGVGLLVRKYGLTIDSLVAADLVTADGRVLRVDEEHEPDLFWAIRGGGGNFGVATRFRFRLEPVDRIVGGMLFLPASADVVAGFVEAAEAAPEELSGIANIMPAPPMPFLPEEHHGKLALMAILVHSAGGEAGERAVAPFRALAEPIADLLRPMPYPEIYPPEDESYHPTAVAHTMFVDRIDHAVADTIMDRLESSNAAMRVTQIRILGGAMARAPIEATAFAHRNSRIMVNLAAFYEGPEDRMVRRDWVDEFAEALQQEDHGAYVNFLADEGEERVRQAYPGPTWDRLAEIKSRYDPTNLFRMNQNVPPNG
jgi:FAD/FMN-containing dehydrogenase